MCCDPFSLHKKGRKTGKGATTKAFDHDFSGNITSIIMLQYNVAVGGAVASWLVRSTLEREVQVQALTSNIVLCSWARHLTLTVPLSTQEYKWVPAKLMRGVTLR